MKKKKYPAVSEINSERIWGVEKIADPEFPNSYTARYGPGKGVLFSIEPEDYAKEYWPPEDGDVVTFLPNGGLKFYVRPEGKR